MAIRTKEELLESIKAKFSDDTDDSTISIIEDISDTLTDYEAKTRDATDWKAEAQRIDAEWREKYKERFFSAPAGDDPNIDDDQEEKPLTYEALFKEE